MAVRARGCDLDPESSTVVEHGSKGIWDAFARGVRNNFLAEFAIQLLRIGGYIFIARELHADNIGIFKILTIVSALAAMLCEAGIPDALIQRQDLRRDHHTTAWWLLLSSAFVVASGLYLVAPIIAALMEMPDLTFGVRLLCIPIFLEGSANLSNARLQRAFRFGALALADVLAEIGFVITALVLLWEHHPRLCLPGALAARYAVHSLAIWIADPRVPFGMPRLGAVRELGRFAMSVCAGRLVVAASANADYIMVGRLLGTTALGFYAIAWDLLRFIPDRLYRIVGRVAFPTFATLQNNNAELAHGYRNFINYIARLILPIAGCAAVAAPELIASVFGKQYLPAGQALRLLSAGLALVGLRIGIGSVFYAKDHPSFDIYLNGCRFALLVVIVYVTSGFGLYSVSAGMSALEGVIAIAGQYLVCMLIGMRLKTLAGEVLPGLRSALLCMLATGIGKAAAVWLGIGPPLVLPFIVLPPAAVLLWLQAGDVTDMVARAFGRTRSEPA